MDPKTNRQDFLFLPHRLEEENRFVILDVRTIQEYVGGHIDGAIHIPYDEIQVHIHKIRSWRKPVITYSKYGRRSQIACSQLSMHGIKSIDGGNIVKVKELFGRLV